MYVLLALVFVLAIVFYLHSVPLRRKHPDDSDAIERSLSEPIGGGTLIGLRTSDKQERPKGHGSSPRKDDGVKKSDANDLKNVQLNRGNLVQVVEKNPPSKEGEKVVEVDFPENGEEIKPMEGGRKTEPAIKDMLKPIGVKDGKAETIELKPKPEERPESKQDKMIVDPVGVNRQRTPPPQSGPTSPRLDKPASQVTGKSQMSSSLHVHPPVISSVNKKSQTSSNNTSQTDSGLYVRSSMPLGPALKIPHTEKQKAIVDAFKHAWSAYKKYAWGEDDLLPLSKSHSSTDFGMAMTLIDSLDTLWLMGLQEEFDEARRWVADNLKFDKNTHKVIVFETNIRVLGGLLSAYHLSQDEMFLKKAVSCVCVGYTHIVVRCQC